MSPVRAFHARVHAVTARRLALAVSLVAGLLPGALSARQAAPRPSPRTGAPGRLDATARPGPTDPAELAAFVDGLMAVQLDERETVGAVVAVVRDGRVMFARGYGHADLEAGRRVDPERTLFRIGSVSKLFVWTSVMQLVEQGRIDLDADLNQYLEAFQLPETWDEPVTLAHVMAHSAGFEDRVVGLFGEVDRPFEEVLAGQIPARVRPPGLWSAYSNHGTAMAAHAAATVAGLPWEELVQRRILDPLGMDRTTFRQPLPEPLSADMSKGYRHRTGGFEERDFETVPLAPVGAASATAMDMARFMIAHLQLGRYGDARILREATARRMQERSFRMAPGVNGMAHGFMEMSDNGVRILGHGGDTRWFHTSLALYPAQGLGVFLSYNSAGGAGGRAGFMEAFNDRYFPVEETGPVATEDGEGGLERFTGKYHGNRYAHTTFAKLNLLGASVRVEATEEGRLRFHDAEWVRTGPLTFGERHGDRVVVFEEDEDGRVTHFVRGDVPVMAWERYRTLENPDLHLTLFVLVGLAGAWTLLAWPGGWLLRRWYGVKSDGLVRISGAARLTLRVAAALFAAFALLLAVFADDVARAVSPGLRVALLLPFAAAVATALALGFAVRLWTRREGRLLARVAYSAVVFSFVTLLWQLQVWNLMGWRF